MRNITDYINNMSISYTAPYVKRVRWSPAGFFSVELAILTKGHGLRTVATAVIPYIGSDHEEYTEAFFYWKNRQRTDNKRVKGMRQRNGL